MEFIEQLGKISKPLKNAVITIGNFDGVHLGHRALFQQVVEKAKTIGGRSVAMTFEPHPIRVLKRNGQPPLITLYEQKIELIEKTGIDVLICVRFTPEFASLSARAFVEDLLVKRIGMKVIVVGEDYTFGRDREGNLDLLRKYADQLGFEVVVVYPVKINKEISGRISSTRIRELINDGRVEDAGILLGRHYQIRGRVVTGRSRGAKVLGFPTANINLHDELCPKEGIYAVTVEYEGRKLPGVANIGYSPTFGDQLFTVEVYILDFNKNIYDQKIRINFIKRLRDEIKFSDVTQLKRAIAADVDRTREILSRMDSPGVSE